MLPTNILYRTFFIRAAEYGTAFTLEVGGSQYLITASHLLGDCGDACDLQILHNKTWLRGTATVIGRGRGEVDVAVLQVQSPLTPPGFDVTPSMGELFVGQDVYFVGYPFKMWVDYGELTAAFRVRF